MSILDYISKDPTVQIFFIIAVAVLLGINFLFINWRRSKKQEQELAIVNPSKTVARYDDGGE